MKSTIKLLKMTIKLSLRPKIVFPYAPFAKFGLPDLIFLKSTEQVVAKSSTFTICNYTATFTIHMRSGII